MQHDMLFSDDVLWDYADGFLSDTEKKQVEAHLQQHPEARHRLQMILSEKQELASLPLEAPGPGFADRVMAAWATEQVKANARANGKDWIIRLIALVFGLFVLTPVVVMVVAALQTTPSETYTLPTVEVPAMDWSLLLDNAYLQYGLLLIFALVGLRFLDKVLQHQRLVHQNLA